MSTVVEKEKRKKKHVRPQTSVSCKSVNYSDPKETRQLKCLVLSYRSHMQLYIITFSCQSGYNKVNFVLASIHTFSFVYISLKLTVNATMLFHLRIRQYLDISVSESFCQFLCLCLCLPVSVSLSVSLSSLSVVVLASVLTCHSCCCACRAAGIIVICD